VCTLAVYTRAWTDLPLVVAANRDEFYERPTLSPRRLGGGSAFGGQDLRAGGSWLTIGRSGMVVGVLNRRTENPPDPGRRSRGELCVALAEDPSMDAALLQLRAQRPDDYNPFNLLLADRRHAYVAQNRRGAITVQALEPGLHLLTNLDLNDITCERISRSTHRFAELVPQYGAHADTAKLVDDLRLVLADHRVALDDRKPTDQLCIHTPAYGTRSSSLILLAETGAGTFLHAHGPPCRTAYRRVEIPWATRSGPTA